eukprot:3645503-Pyramimonas_sp.AAC.1
MAQTTAATVSAAHMTRTVQNCNSPRLVEGCTDAMACARAHVPGAHVTIGKDPATNAATWNCSMAVTVADVTAPTPM